MISQISPVVNPFYRAGQVLSGTAHTIEEVKAEGNSFTYLIDGEWLPEARVKQIEVDAYYGRNTWVKRDSWQPARLATKRNGANTLAQYGRAR